MQPLISKHLVRHTIFASSCLIAHRLLVPDAPLEPVCSQDFWDFLVGFEAPKLNASEVLGKVAETFVVVAVLRMHSIARYANCWLVRRMGLLTLWT
jgi:hypothetical protein